MKKLLILGLALVVSALTFAVGQRTSAEARFQARTDEEDICTACHTEGEETLGVRIDLNELHSSVHEAFSCKECHKGVGNSHGPRVPKVDCSTCHHEESEGFQKGIHWKEQRKGNQKAPVCTTCHGAHGILAEESADSRISRKKIALTCGECHQEQSELFMDSIHANALSDSEKEDYAPTCSTCHGEHVIRQSGAPASPTSQARLPSTCGGCHDDPEFARVMSVPSERLQSYKDSIHGLRNRFGRSAATCKDCHGEHLVLARNDPRSKISSDNIVKTCGQCHEGANENFAAAQVHVQATLESSPGVFAIRWFYIIFIAVLVLGFVVHIVFDFLKLRKRRREKLNE